MTADQLGVVFAALADPTRRTILARLADEPFAMTAPAVSKHLKVLERTGLIAHGRQAQWRPCELETEPLRAATAWLSHLTR